MKNVNCDVRTLAVRNKLTIKSYLGVPIFYKNGDLFGTLCVVDCKETEFEEEDIQILQRYARLFSSVIELERDPLTSLYSRYYLFDNFHYVGTEGVLLYLDLDGFKQVNDDYGHDIGDIVLKEVGSKIKKCLSAKDIAVRLGGDEFVLILPHMGLKSSIEKTCNFLLTELSNWESFYPSVRVSTSVGVVCFPKDGIDLKELLKKADSAMYEAKVSGKNRWKMYDG